ncbi:MAG: 3-hydroxyacyl-CoA dehydrogenase family protein [Candidatus Eisenbacteria bacterium]|uniref:3-hydroxyacyl-CoA dehydrogenase family protein n=1 Tax=Eiseniibacteriota bacterium TaxID=2212470 RepID=A0A948W663_UNCEI|nr:3-hydroxyacyl-CoA dehydrogenase family protein [Candidatus Eisenbacteria bacterium]MBU1950456.1 3-hydroxyacyl-CoA dehydrogenase family protein [Candidatus Eisenbacteria bacterium]MBU2690775.1 3-hydroxyacyl-CoA dehydrogenase family protein [Candidatus Eisenbacteria bacterium]
MELAERYENVGVIGAAGKMGSGIALLLSQQMAERKLDPKGKGRHFRLVAMDVDDAGLDGLRSYLAAQMRKAAEKMTVALRGLYADRADLVENSEIIDAFIDDAVGVVRFTTDLNALKDCHMIFEAIAENIPLKVKIYSRLNELCGPDTWFFTNTSSVPISLLDRDANLGGRIIGYHFYNPPAVQKLLELITTPATKPELIEAGKAIAADLRKKVIPANDIAGFIGNGHFIRDGLHGIAETERLAKEHGFAEAVYMVNRVSQDWLVRPMGIFQLIDYVGVDVFQCILGVMNPHIDGEDLHSDLIDKLMKAGVKGGQNPDGSQKNGILQYVKGRPAGAYSFDKSGYVPLEAAWTGKLDALLGALPAGHAPWKALMGDPGKDEKLAAYFKNMKKDAGMGSRLGTTYLKRSKEIGEHLVSSGVAAQADDVNGVLMNGFFHLYGPINDYA